MAGQVRIGFVEPMLLLPTDKLPEGPNWSYELKLDGYRAVAVKSNGTVQLRSRNNKDFNARYPAVAHALSALPDNTVIDGEIVALDATGRPSFNSLQNVGTLGPPVFYYVFDVLVVGGRNVMAEPLTVRRRLLHDNILQVLNEPVRPVPQLNARLADVIEAVRAQGLEGLVAKLLDSKYEPGLRSGAWQKMRLNRAGEFVIGGYTRGGRTFDALVFGYYEGDRLLYAGRTRSGFTPAAREHIAARFRGLETAACPFANLPEAKSRRWGQGLTADKMKDCVWRMPVLVAQIEYVEWTQDGHLRHSRFVGMSNGTNAGDVKAR